MSLSNLLARWRGSPPEASRTGYGAIEAEGELPQQDAAATAAASILPSDESGLTTHHGNTAATRPSSLKQMFSDVRSEEDETKQEVNHESEFYLQSSVLSRAFPERYSALIVTLILEIPVLLMISGGSDALCTLIGRSKYQLLVGFLPLTSAISGNVGLQASTLTTRAISHSHVTAADFTKWLRQEIGAAAFLGLGMGILLGTIAYFASGSDAAFGITIFIAQILSIVTAGVTGTLAPLIFSFLFRRDSGKWGGPMETAIQDIVGGFAMVVVSYHILKYLGPGPIDEYDQCGPTR
jgi:Mg/Co/Ni transporter MgtE